MLLTSSGSRFLACLVCAGTLSACAEQRITNAPPAVVEDCRGEVALITEREPELARNDRLPGGAGEGTGEVIEDARAAREEAEQPGLAGWPEDVLLYRCLASRGVLLTDEQAQELAEWEGRTEPDPEEEPDPED